MDSRDGVSFTTTKRLGHGVEGEVWLVNFKRSKVDIALKQVQARLLADSLFAGFSR